MRLSERARHAALDVLQTLLRMLPWPTQPGLRAVGQPDAQSPVVLTGNYDLSVRRVARALRGHDAWLVVAPSGGINVWCAASGGHLTTHQVVTALKTSGVADRVGHRRVILPQLAATGVVAIDVFRRCHWSAHFGPVRAEDLPAYLAGSAELPPEMRRVRFGARERLEMAAVWGGPSALVLGGVGLWVHPTWALPLAGLAALAAVLVFASYDRLPRRARWLLGPALAVTSAGVAALAGGGATAVGAAGLAALGLAALLTFDHAGSTPIEGGSHFDERRWHIRLDRERCAGVLRCVEVCPEACFERPEPPPNGAARAPGQPRKGATPVRLSHDERCIRCGACVVQCPKDALFFEAEDGSRIEPGTIRRYKLNLLGQRRVDAGPGPAGQRAGGSSERADV